MLRNTYQYGVRAGLVSLLIALSAGCAKTPAGVGGSSGTQLLVSFQVQGTIRPDYYYFVLFNPVTTPGQSVGPEPVVAPPWGNGFAYGQFTAFLQYSSGQPYSDYGFYTVLPGPDYLPIGPSAPTQLTPVQAGGNTIQFQISLAALGTSSLPADQIQYVQFNIVATNRVPKDPTDTNPKLFDALGDPRLPDGLNDPVTIPVTQSGTYQNSSQVQPEPSGDVGEWVNGQFVSDEDPDLDIVNWQIEVRS